MKLFLYATARRGWLLRAESPEAAADVLLTYEPAPLDDPDGVRQVSSPGTTDQRGALARTMTHVPLTGASGRIFQWGV